MRLSLMHRVMQSVGPDWSCPFAEQLLEPWGYDPGTVYYFRGSANFLCLFRRDGQRYFLRFNEASERPLVAVQSEIALVDWLHKNGIRVAAPIPSRAGRHSPRSSRSQPRRRMPPGGRLVESVTTELGTFTAVVFPALPGAHPELAELGAEGFQAWGAALGQLHALLKSAAALTTPEGAPVAQGRPSWRDQLELARSFIAADEVALLAEWEALRTWAETLPTGPDEYGLIHYDFELDNLLWQEEQITILDFDDCLHAWYAADIAYALRDLFEDGVDLNAPRFQAFVAGYREHHPVSDEMLAELPNFLRLHRMALFGRLSRALDLEPGQELPDWLRGLSAKLQQRVDRYRLNCTRSAEGL